MIIDVVGDAGVGKSRLVREVLAGSTVPSLTLTVSPMGTRTHTEPSATPPGHYSACAPTSTRR